MDERAVMYNLVDIAPKNKTRGQFSFCRFARRQGGGCATLSTADNDAPTSTARGGTVIQQGSAGRRWVLCSLCCPLSLSSPCPYPSTLSLPHPVPLPPGCLSRRLSCSVLLLLLVLTYNTCLQPYARWALAGLPHTTCIPSSARYFRSSSSQWEPYNTLYFSNSLLLIGSCPPPKVSNYRPTHTHTHTPDTPPPEKRGETQSVKTLRLGQTVESWPFSCGFIHGAGRPLPTAPGSRRWLLY